MASVNQSVDQFPAKDVVHLDCGEGTSALVHLHGSTLLSWKVNGEEIIFVSDKAVFDGKKAIRGGVPIVFPNFGPWKLGPQHGFGRIKRWKVGIPATKDKHGTVIAALVLEDDEETRKMWDYGFKLVYTLELQPTSFTMNLSIHNTDSKTFTFTTLLHTYLRTPDILSTSVTGLSSVKYVDKLKDNKCKSESRERVFMDENYDRVYAGCPNHLVVNRVGCGQHDLSIKTFNLPDTVLWNPWEEKAKQMSDFGDEEYKHMICVEGGFVDKPVSLDGGQQFECSQKFSLTPSR